MKKIPNVLTIQDFCCVGRCALTVTIPVLSSLGVQPIALPTSLFSNTPFFSHMTFHELTDQAYSCIDTWVENGFTFDAIQSGFLSSPEQTNIVIEAFDRFAREDMLRIVDPAMADNGALYSVFDDYMVTAMKELVSHAQITTPNYTEALLLTDREYEDAPIEWDAIKELCSEVQSLGPEKVIITSVPTEGDLIRTALYDSINQSFIVIDTPQVPMSAPGTGDIFTAILTGNLLKGSSIEEATRKAVVFTHKCIKYTYENNASHLYGVLLEDVLPQQEK